MHEMNKRKKNVLQAIVREYIVNASPVGSRTIARRYDLEVSPATIRNEMADLEELGYLMQPHTSAGRIPSDKGYRFYVDNLMPENDLTREEERFISRALKAKAKAQNIKTIVSETSRLLSFITDYTSLVLKPDIKKTGLEKIQLFRPDRRHVLVVIITDTGLVEHEMIPISEDITDRELENIGSFLNSRLHGLTLEEIDEDLLGSLEEEIVAQNEFILDTVDLICQTLNTTDVEHISMDGTPNILEQPEFMDDLDKVKKLLHILEEGRILIDILNRTCQVPGVVISIGSENDYEEIQECSLITACYRIGKRNIGSLGVLGPTRMKYPRVISAVDYIARCLSEALTELNEEGTLEE